MPTITLKQPIMRRRYVDVPQFYRFRNRVTLYTTQDIPDAHGGFSQIDVVFAECWASVTQLSGLEIERAGGMATEDWVEIETWYIPNTTPLLTAKMGSHVWDVQHVDDVSNKHLFMVLKCKERKDV